MAMKCCRCFCAKQSRALTGPRVVAVAAAAMKTICIKLPAAMKTAACLVATMMTSFKTPEAGVTSLICLRNILRTFLYA